MLIYIASSYRNIHAVQLLTQQLSDAGHEVLDWTQLVAMPEGLTASARKTWFDSNEASKVFRFCVEACAGADLLIYLGKSGQDAGIEVGIAFGAGVPVLGIRGSLEDTGLMLNGAVDHWVDTVVNLPELIERLWGSAC